MAGAVSAARAPAHGGGRGRIYVEGLACGAVAALATPSAVLAAALLLPAVLAWFAGATPGRPLARCMILFGVAGALPSLAALWRGPDTLAAALDAALDLHDLALAWAAQAAGWLLAEALPLAGMLLADAGAARHARQLRAERARIAEEWSLPGEG